MKIYLKYPVVLIFVSVQLHAKPFRGPRVKRLASRDKSKFWPHGCVPYTFDRSFNSTERDVIKRAMEDIEKVSCIRFKKRTYETGYADIRKPEEGCSADVGYTGSRRELNLGGGCLTSNTVIHEILHILGFEHEHIRPDRDDYIVVQNDNIQPDSLSNFNKKSWEHFTSFGLPYDFDSIMHYKDRTFAIDSSKKTIERIGSNLGIEEGVGMSKIDIQKLNKMYRCPKKGSSNFISHGRRYGSKWNKSDYRRRHKYIYEV